MKAIRAILLIAVMTFAAQTQAQSLREIGNTVKSKVTSAAREVASAAKETVASQFATNNIVTGLLGTASVEASHIEGTWTYKTPCLIFSSESMLAAMGSNLVTGKISSALEASLTKSGIKPGSLILIFDAAGNCTINSAGKSVHTTYMLNGSTLTLTFPVTRQSVAMNVNLKGNNLQIGMKLDKLLALLQGVSDINNSSVSTLNTIAALLKNYDGMQLGLQFVK